MATPVQNPANPASNPPMRKTSRTLSDDYRSLRLENESIKIEIAQFYALLSMELEFLKRKISQGKIFSFDFVFQCIRLLRSVDTRMLVLMEKFWQLRKPTSPVWQECAHEYNNLIVQIQDVYVVCRKSAKLFKAYQASEVKGFGEKLKDALDAHRKFRRGRALAEAHKAIAALNATYLAAQKMKSQIEDLVSSQIVDMYLGLASTLCIEDVESSFSKWNGLSGAMFAMRNASLFISYMLLATFGEVHTGFVFRLQDVHFDAPWAASLCEVHSHGREEILKISSLAPKEAEFMLGAENRTLNHLLSDISADLGFLTEDQSTGCLTLSAAHKSHWKLLAKNAENLKHHLTDMRSTSKCVRKKLKDLDNHMCWVQSRFWSMCTEHCEPRRALVGRQARRQNHSELSDSEEEKYEKSALSTDSN